MGKCAEKCTGCGRVCCDLSWQFFLIFITCLGIAFSLGAVLDCNFYKITYTWTVTPAVLPNITGIGLFLYEATTDGSEECIRYDGDEYENWIDDPIRMASAFGSAAVFLGFIGLCIEVLGLFLLFCVEVKGLKWIIGTAFIVAMILQGMTFSFVATDFCWRYDEILMATPQCKIGRSAGWSIAAICLYFWAGVQVCAMSWPDQAICKERCCRACCNDEDEDVEAQKDEEKAETQEEEKPEPPPEAAPEEDPNAAAAAAAGAAGGAAAAAALDEEEEEKEEGEGEEGDAKGEEEAVEEAQEDVKASVKSENSDFSEDDDDDDSSFDEADDDEKEEGMKNEEEESKPEEKEEGADNKA